MSRKTHPIGFRLGVTQSSVAQLQCYGKNSNQAYSLVTLKLWKLSELLWRMFDKSKMRLSNYEWQVKDNRLSSNITYTLLEGVEKKRNADVNRTNKYDLINYIPQKAADDWMKNLVRVRLFNVHWLHDPKTLASWISNQLLQRQSIKTIFKLLKKELHQNKSWEHKTKAFVSGNTKFSLTGIKIVCCGRLGGKRQRMSNSVSKQLGVMPLQSLNMFIEYEKSSLCTRFGKIGIHVYYQYSKI